MIIEILKKKQKKNILNYLENLRVKLMEINVRKNHINNSLFQAQKTNEDSP